MGRVTWQKRHFHNVGDGSVAVDKTRDEFGVGGLYCGQYYPVDKFYPGIHSGRYSGMCPGRYSGRNPGTQGIVVSFGGIPRVSRG